MDEVPSWWPPVWSKDVGKVPTAHIVLSNGNVYRIIDRRSDRDPQVWFHQVPMDWIRHKDDMLEVFCDLLEIERNEKLASNTHGTSTSGGSGE